MSLAGAGVTEAQMSPNQVGESQLFDTKLGITGLAVADDEQPVVFRQSFHGIPDAGIPNAAGVTLQIFVLHVHAPLHQGIALRGGNGREKNVGYLVHDLAEQGDKRFRLHRQMGQTFFCKLNVIPFRYQRPGVPQGAVNVKNQAFVLHISSKCR